MQTVSAIYDPYLNYTPSQRKEADGRRERLARIAAAAKPDTPILCRSASPHPSVAVEVKPAEPAPEFSFDDWVRRQEQNNPLPKEPWFSIIGETDPPEPVRPKVEDIQRAVAKHYGVSRSDILSARRTANIVRPRQVAAYLAKKLTLRSLPEIGRRMGQRDHTTILSSVRKITRLLASDDGLAETISILRREILDAHR